jgi:hypothetical protein
VDVAASWSLLEALVEATGSDMEGLERISGKVNRVHVHVRLFPEGFRGSELSLIALGRIWSGSVARQLNRDPA